MDQAQRKHYYNRCKPSEALSPHDDRYVPIDQLGSAEHRVRGEDWVAKLARRVELSDEPVCELLTGLPGSGKSTELRRLAQRLEDAGKANLLPVIIAAEETFDLATQIDIPDIVFAILDRVERAVLERELKDPDQSMEEGVFSRVWNWLRGTEATVKQVDLAVPKVGRVVVELKTQPTLRAQVRQAVGLHLSQFLDKVHAELIHLRGRAEKLGHAGIVVIFDSLEKLRGISSNWMAVLESAERVFAGGAPYLRLPVHVLYTIPTALVARRRFEHVHFMPMIKLSNQDGSPFEDGVDAAYRIVTQRAPEKVLMELFGGEMQERVRRLIELSGGYPREIVRLLQSTIAMDPWPVLANDFQRVLNEVGDQYSMLVPTNAYEWLARVAVEQQWTADDDEHRAIADLMLSNNAVLRYLNNQQWFDLHPAVRSIPGVDAAIKVLRARRSVAST